MLKNYLRTAWNVLMRRRAFTGSNGAESGAAKLMGLFIILGIGFMLLPSINLINLNISRILGRSSEIGVRKAFGASSQQLVVQFVVENLVITTFGGLFGLIFSWLILYQIEASQVQGDPGS